MFSQKELEIVERLKDNKKAFGLCEPEEQRVFSEVGVQKCEQWNCHRFPYWTTTGAFTYSSTYRVKKDYRPPAEIERCEVWPPNECFTYLHYCRSGQIRKSLAAALSDPDFIDFEYADGIRRNLPRFPSEPKKPAQVPVAVLFRRSK